MKRTIGERERGEREVKREGERGEREVKREGEGREREFGYMSDVNVDQGKGLLFCKQ